MPPAPPQTPVPMPLDPAIEAVRGRTRKKARQGRSHLSTILTSQPLGSPSIAKTVLGVAGVPGGGTK